eukprot:TRINITY_DN3524_c0_g1_i1.p1 TRINITY_DN3524_c0_g1~~TRINITY_DN3524_c0_g1_i1.p1  ORF type:complete len:195 (-),score=7.54 TRINITY_DN3524_c0_g1_i1:159-743(-)
MMVIISFYIVRQNYTFGLMCIIKAGELAILTLIFILVFSRIGVHLFTWNENLYDQTSFLHGTAPYIELEPDQCQLQESTPDFYTPKACWLPEETFESFDSIMDGALALFVLISSENYPAIMYPPRYAYYSYQWFFIVFLIFGHFFFLNMFVALVYESYRGIWVSFIVKERQMEEKNLTRAWQCLDEKGDRKYTS